LPKHGQEALCCALGGMGISGDPRKDALHLGHQVIDGDLFMTR
jgi:hypothetical protein